MTNPNIKWPVRAWLALSICAALGISMQAQAALLQGTAPTVNGTASSVLDTDTGLEWLTPQVTKGLSFAAVAAGGYLSNRYRYATSSELVGLLGHSGYNTAPLMLDPRGGNWSRLESDITSLGSLISMLGATAGSAKIYGILADLQSTYGDQALDHSLATLFTTSAPNSYVLAVGPASPTSDFDTGSFLVRQISPVPEPTVVGMFTAGLLLLSGIARSRRQ